MFISLIYVSRRISDRLPPNAEIDEIIAGLTESNARLGVRGAMLLTRQHVAQVLEGPEAAIDRLIAGIGCGPLHGQVIVIERKPIDGYRFPDWCFAYWGDATYMDQKIGAVLEKQDALTRAGWTTQLYDLMRRLAHESRDHRGPIGKPPSP